jgi:hypothetical protein
VSKFVPPEQRNVFLLGTLVEGRLPEDRMRGMLAMIIAVAATAGASAQESCPSGKSLASPESTGQTDLRAHQKHQEQQPQGRTGPLDTTSGGAPAESPQGQSPPGMQAAPEGSSKTIIDEHRP